MTTAPTGPSLEVLVHQIRYSPVLARLDHASLGRLLAVARQVEVPAENRVHVAHEPLRSVGLVIDGALKLIGSDVAGRENLFGLATPGDLVGACEALEGAPASWDVVAAVRSQVILLDPATFVEVVGGSAQAACELVISEAARVRSLATMLLERSDGDITNRVAGRLVDLAEMLGTMRAGAIELELPISRTELGQLAGVSRESTCRSLRFMHRAGALRCERRKIRIVDEERLRAFSCGAPSGGSSPSSEPEANPRSLSSVGT